jgi:hypothetical protein
MSLDRAFNLIIIIIAFAALDMVVIAFLLASRGLCFIAIKLIFEKLNDTLSFIGYFYRVRHLLVHHPRAIDDFLDSPPLAWVLLKHASEQILQLLAGREFQMIPVR